MWVTSIAQNAFDPVSQKVSCPSTLLIRPLSRWNMKLQVMTPAKTGRA